jgi:hypothetical protein
VLVSFALSVIGFVGWRLWLMMELVNGAEVGSDRRHHRQVAWALNLALEVQAHPALYRGRRVLMLHPHELLEDLLELPLLIILPGVLLSIGSLLKLQKHLVQLSHHSAGELLVDMVPIYWFEESSFTAKLEDLLVDGISPGFCWHLLLDARESVGSFSLGFAVWSGKQGRLELLGRLL